MTLDGTTIEEVEHYHRALQLAVAEANRQYREWRQEQEQLRTREQSVREEHQKRVEESQNEFD